MCNPTVFEITSATDQRLFYRLSGRDFIWHKELLADKGRLYGSYYRPGEFWTEEVFVCPFCVHATLLSEGEGESQTFYCKYCYNHWQVGKGCMLMEVHDWDDDGNILNTRLI